MPIYNHFFELEGVNQLFAAKLESAFDNSTIWEDVRFNANRGLMEYADVGFTSLHIADCDALARMANILGRPAYAVELRARSSRCQAGLHSLWDEQIGMFLNRHTDTGEFNLRLTPSHFFPLLTDAVSPAQAERMVKEHFYNPTEFWGEWFPGCVIPNGQAAPVEFHWIPSGLGDGSGTITGTVANVAFTKAWTNSASAATFNACGLFVAAQGADEPQLQFDAWFDTVQYKLYGLIGLTLQRVSANQIVLSWTADGYTLQYNDSSIANAGGWATSPDPVVLVGGTYYSTNTISSGTRFFRLKGNCP